MAKSGLIEKMQARDAAREFRIKMWTIQACLDAVVLILNDAEVMGKGRALGAEKLKRVAEAYGRVVPEVMIGLSAYPENDYMREVIDRRLRKILGDSVIPWGERYDGWDEKSARRRSVSK